VKKPEFKNIGLDINSNLKNIILDRETPIFYSLENNGKH